MDYRRLGRTGLEVSPLCLGAMMFGAWGNRDHDDSIGIIHAALDAGINFIDTADMYSNGESEVIVGKALADRRDDVILATKVHGPMGGSSRSVSRVWLGSGRTTSTCTRSIVRILRSTSMKRSEH
jgi:aryl-alcohol dehydrogenase-like predicted oxidoreductase